MKTITIITILLLSISAKAQYTIDFENFTFPDSLEYDNGENPENLVDGFFEFYPLKFPNVFNDEWNFWQSGWAVSSVKDSVTSGFMNMYAARPGGAASGENYVVGQNGAVIFHSNLQYLASGISFKITNSTYAALSMRDGDDFGKKFGGESGNDPDYFLVRLSLKHDNLLVYSQDIYLADYRFEDNSLDYILEDWIEITEPLNFYYFNEASFELFSSDTGVFGINTPLFFCIDDIYIHYAINSINNFTQKTLKLFPNPTKDLLTIQIENQQSETFQIIDLYGRVVRTMQIVTQQTVDVHDLAPGIYLIRGEDGRTSRFVKQ